jgi:replicative DNA helicase
MGKDASVLIDEAEAKIFQIAEARSKARQGFVKIDPLLTETIERIDMLYSRENKNEVIGVPSGFVDLDRMTSGLQPGELIIVAGRPSMGKTTLVMNMAEHVALAEKKSVAVFSMEMSGPQLAMRMIGSVGRVDQHELRTGTFKEDDWSRLVDAVGRLNEAQIYIDDTAGLNVLEVRSRARRLHRQCGGLALLVIDYLQLMSGTTGGREENRATEIAEISRSLKSLAKELKVPVIALSQLNRSVDARQDKRPMMSDLRESGAIEQDADLILFIYRDEVYNPDSPRKGISEIIIAKQRNGPVGKIDLTFLGKFTRFENYAGSDRF